MCPYFPGFATTMGTIRKWTPSNRRYAAVSTSLFMFSPFFSWWFTWIKFNVNSQVLICAIQDACTCILFAWRRCAADVIGVTSRNVGRLWWWFWWKSVEKSFGALHISLCTTDAVHCCYSMWISGFQEAIDRFTYLLARGSSSSCAPLFSIFYLGVDYVLPIDFPMHDRITNFSTPWFLTNRYTSSGWQISPCDLLDPFRKEGWTSCHN